MEVKDGLLMPKVIVDMCEDVCREPDCAESGGWVVGVRIVRGVTKVEGILKKVGTEKVADETSGMAAGTLGENRTGVCETASGISLTVRAVWTVG